MRPVRERGARLFLGFAFAAATLLVAPVAQLVPATTAKADSSFADSHFRETQVFGGLNNPTKLVFAADGRAFVGEKGGVVKAFTSINDTSPTTVVDLSTTVMNYWDRGLLGMALDPAFLSGRPYLYLYYVVDAPQGQSPPVWNDTCPGSPSGPGATTDGCVVYSKLSRFTIDLSTNVAVGGSRVDLISDWCSQYPSHSGGGMVFGDDGYLYLSGGDGASFTFADYGQGGGTVPNATNPITPINPCGDPLTVTSPAGTPPVVDVATAEGGSLRAQDLQTSGDPVTLDGSLIRVNPDTGNGAPDNPLHASSDANARRIVAYGFRNPFRLTKDPDNGDIYIGDVGSEYWEEINRLPEPGTGSTVKDFGWPCYEGGIQNNTPTSFKGALWQSMGNNLCDNLYAQGLSAVEKPVYGYYHAGANAPCGVSGDSSASITGVAFYEASAADQNAYPARYNDALFFADYSRNCLGMLRRAGNGVPDASTWEVVATNVGHPVDLLTGPHGDLYYVDLNDSEVMRISYMPSPVARGSVTPPVSIAPVTVTLDASASTDPDVNATLVSWDWDLDHNGTFNGPADKSGKVVQWNITTPGDYPITLRVTSSNGLSDTEELVVHANNAPPVATIDTPAASLTWAVGDEIDFSGHGTDPEDGALPPADLSWQVILHHCSQTDCHEHFLQTFTGVASGSFDAPDHPYPSYLELRLTATDSLGAAVTTSVSLQPKTTTLHVTSSPTGVPIDVGTGTKTSPSDTTVIRGGTISLTAPAAYTAGAKHYRFGSWSDGKARVHDVVVTDPASLTATYVPDAPDTCATAQAITPGAWTSERASGAGDEDWFKFSVSGTHRTVVTLGDLPVDARLELYSGCSTLLATSDQAGNRFERISRSLATGTYRVRVLVPSGASSLTPYAVQALVVGPTVAFQSRTGTWSSGTLRVVGDVVNGSGKTVGRVAVTGTFRDAGGNVVATLQGSTFANRLGDGATSSFVLSGKVPTYSTVSWALTPGAPGPVRTLSLHAFASTAGAGGTVTESGKVRNDGSTKATAVAVARTWYGSRGQVIEVRIANVNPTSLAAGRVGTFQIVRAAIPAAQAATTALRAS